MNYQPLFYVCGVIVIIGIISLFFWLWNKNENKDNLPLLGFGLQGPDSNITETIMDLSKLPANKHVRYFWNWSSNITESDGEKYYNWNSKDLPDIQFLPMLWGSTVNDKVYREGKNNEKILMLSNEPDMIGGCTSDERFDNGNCKSATSSGYWVSTGEYGCFETDGCTTKNVNSGNNTFSVVLKQLMIQTRY